ncbi:TPA: leucine-rich repeat domain-containing protein [Listeria monocytogenes]|nr:leucine-rich repeat domain-containing protein [Listeria monocytogenes]EKA2552377.1 leucine-rich repeat domain-containing protein [Listeria monocytogenes]EKA2555497.1 leucine-rich repeat domain-containing protein [Listeria monocytogenes]EKA2558655.1 leucine-rich repeat domain-containing protein [Listeria monocytogenes]EKA2561778.1 leucine-rich repeat domain-containing protein [Listeria monocytogenes]
MRKLILTTIACMTLVSFSPLAEPTEVEAAKPNISNTQIKNLQEAPPAAINEIFPDDALSFKVAQELSVSEDTVVTQEQLDTIKTMVYVEFGVKDLSGMEYLHNLHVIDLSQNEITNIDSLAKLTNLEEISLNQNQIVDISPLMNLPLLNNLEIEGNQIASLPSFDNLVNLKILDLNNNQLSDISNLKVAKQLTDLYISNNNISDISILSNLEQLQSFYAETNQLTSLESLQNKVYLEDFDADYNQIKDVTPLSTCPNLKYIQIEANQISDFSSLSNQHFIKFEANGQEVYLPPVMLGQSTSIVLKDNKGVTLTDWIWDTPGVYENDTLTWQNSGDNSAYFLNNQYPTFPSVDVSVYQTVTPN